jgi:hypothetical protein
VDLIATVSELTTVIADSLIILPFISRNIRRKLFKAIIADILYDIVTGQDGQTKQFIDTMQNVVNTYKSFSNPKSKSTKEVDD